MEEGRNQRCKKKKKRWIFFLRYFRFLCCSEFAQQMQPPLASTVGRTVKRTERVYRAVLMRPSGARTLSTVFTVLQLYSCMQHALARALLDPGIPGACTRWLA